MANIKMKTSDSSKYATSGTLNIKITPADNAWNKAAVCLALEAEKVPSLRKKDICGDDLVLSQKRRSRHVVRMTTSEWNILALKAMQNQKED